MRALICDGYDGIDALRVGELADPTPGTDELLIEVEAATVNFADTLTVAGLYQVRPPTPFAPGQELAGTVVESRSAAFDIGDRVTAFTYSGAMAERAAVPTVSAIRLPDDIASDVGSTIPIAYGTSYHALVDRGGLRADETLLVLGAAGGVGMAAVQIGKALGAEVLAAVSSDAKASAVSAAGADHVIRYDREPIRDAIKAVTGGGVDVVYDPVGGDMTELALRSTNWNGRLLVIGFASGTIPSIPINLTLVKGNSLVGVFWGRFATEEPEKCRANGEAIMEMVSAGRLTPSIQKVFSLDDSISAMRWVADRKAIGRVIITP